jgi:uncharacterized LabA/DUF88 family protein
MPTAILVDGSFFLKRYKHVYGFEHTPEQVAKNLFTMCIGHLHEKRKNNSFEHSELNYNHSKKHRRSLYRIFFYDCPPLSKKAHNPISKKAIDFAKSPIYQFRTALHRELIKLRKVALRLGRLGENQAVWQIKSDTLKALLAKRVPLDRLQESDVYYDVRQKGVDMRIGLDIASLAYKHLVDQIILVAGDSDFVPAAKLARREGIDFVLDPMWQKISDDLFEHIDGLQSVCPKPMQKHIES